MRHLPPSHSVWRWWQRSTLTFGAKSLVVELLKKERVLFTISFCRFHKKHFSSNKPQFLNARTAFSALLLLALKMKLPKPFCFVLNTLLELDDRAAQTLRSALVCGSGIALEIHIFAGRKAPQDFHIISFLLRRRRIQDQKCDHGTMQVTISIWPRHI